MDRIEIAQAALNAKNGGNYLEIGVCTGTSFIPLQATRKWGVDPAHSLSWKRIAKYNLLDLLNVKREKIFRKTSDDFFKTHSRMLKRHGIDVSFIDGLHTYEQALRDVINCLKYLKPKGLVLMHDCNPTDEIAAFPAAGIEEVAAMKIPGWSGGWNGDVWKAIVHLRSLRDDLNVFVLDCDNGIGVVSRERASERLAYSEQQIRKMDYTFLESNRKHLLGLRSPESFFGFLKGQS